MITCRRNRRIVSIGMYEPFVVEQYYVKTTRPPRVFDTDKSVVRAVKRTNSTGGVAYNRVSVPRVSILENAA